LRCDHTPRGQLPLVALAKAQRLGHLAPRDDEPTPGPLEFEVVLFLYGIAVSGGTGSASMMAGGAIGLLGGVLVSTLLYLGLAAIPLRSLFSVTSALITLLAAGRSPLS
jgi:Iron permease FTR1 family